MEEETKGKKKPFGKKKDGKAEKKDKGYKMFEEENSEEESLMSPEEKDSRKIKKHNKPSFKFVKKEKSYKVKEKEKEEKRKDEKKKDGKIKLKKKRHLPDNQAVPVNEKPIFGVPLAVAVARNKSYDGIQLPIVFRECIDYVEEFGLACEGIYRISGVKSKVQALKDAYNKGIPVYLQEYEPNIVAGLLKQFLRELPEPVLTAELMPKFEQASTIKNTKQRVLEFQRLIEQLPTCNRLLLSWVIVHMIHVITKEKQNKMSLQNVSIVLSPTMQISHRVLNILFTASGILFKDTVIKKYVPPLKPVTSRWSLDLPESPTSLEEELKKQESLLDELHKEVMRVKDTNKEEQLWEVQRVVTGLKRKLKMIKKGQSYSPSTSRLMVGRNIEKKEPDMSKTGGEELDLCRAESFSQVRHSTSSSSSQHKAVMSHSRAGSKHNKSDQSQGVTHQRGGSGTSKRVELRPVGGASSLEDTGMDIEMDSSARSHSQKERADSAKIEIQNDAKPDSQPLKSEVSAKSLSDRDQSRKSPTHTEGKALPETKQSADLKKSQSSQDKIKESKENNESTVENTNVQSQEDTGQSKPEDVVLNESNEKEAPEIEREISSDYVSRTPENTCDSVESIDDSDVESEPVQEARPEISEKHSKLKVVSQLPVPTSSPANYIDEPDETKETIEAPQQSEPIEPKPDIAPPEVQSEEPQVEVETKPEVPIKPKTVPEIQETDRSEQMHHQTHARGPSLDGGIAPEQLAAALNDLVINRSEESLEVTDEQGVYDINETEEERNQRIMSQFVADFGIEKPEECDEEYEQLLEEYTALMLEEEELVNIGEELRKKIESEQYEAERLDEELTEIRAMREDLYSSDEMSDSSSSEEEQDEEDLLQILDQLSRENQTLEVKNKDLTEKIHQEVQDCLKVKVQIRLLQHKQLESSKNNELDLLCL